MPTLAKNREKPRAFNFLLFKIQRKEEKNEGKN